MDHSQTLFLYFVFSMQLTENIVYINFADDWIQTADLWCQKRSLNQLSHKHCPVYKQVTLEIIDKWVVLNMNLLCNFLLESLFESCINFCTNSFPQIVSQFMHQYCFLFYVFITHSGLIRRKTSY